MIKKNFKNEKLPEIYSKQEHKEDRATTTENKKIDYA